MTDEGLTRCLDTLAAMPAGRAQDAKWDALRKLYATVLACLSDEDGLAAVEHAALTEEWQPSPARLRRIAAEVASPIPDAEHAYAEIIHRAQVEGLYGRPVHGRPHCKVEGSPLFSHPLVDQIVLCCGGWGMVCSGEAGLQEGLKKQVRSAHASVAEAWHEQVWAQLLKPSACRDRRLFPRWTPYALPCGWEEAGSLGGEVVGSLEPPDSAVPMPEFIKQLAGLKGME
jgi:hypothetical protein